jgi:hypothetical protein
MKTLTIGASAGALLCSFALAGAQPAPPDIPKGNHYVCYPVKVETFKQRTATFRDQFGVWKMTVIKPTHLCTPAEKRVDNQIFPMTDPKLHVLCYQVKYEGKLPPSVMTNDQFGTLKMGLNPATTVCLPAGKTVIK